MEFDGEDFTAVEERLNLLNRLKEKYGQTIEDVIAYGEERARLLEKISDYDAYMQLMEEKLAAARKKLEAACAVLSGIRKKMRQCLQSC